MIALPDIAVDAQIYSSNNSVVYRGIKLSDCTPVILKVLKQDYPTASELTRYRQEYEITRSLNLEGAIKAYSQQEYQRTLIILLEDFGGESLERWIQQRPDFCPMPLSAFLSLAIKITGILDRIHAAGVIHKDINPSNIVFNLDTGVVKFIDFGIATRFNRTNPTFKNPHVIEGTLAYLSPEQTGRMNRLLDYRTDLYSLGVTFYELLTGQLPFATTDILELVHCHLAKSPIPPHELKATIPKAVSDIVLKLMAKNAEDRYRSAWGIKADLEICADQLKKIGQVNSIQLGLLDIWDQFQIPQKLYGRDQEVARLLAAFVRVACPLAQPPAGKDSGFASENLVQQRQEQKLTDNQTFKVEMMLVSGYAGIGKSALVQELYKPITAKRGYFIWGKFDQFGRNIPYSAIANALQKLVQQLLGEPDEQLQQWRSQLLTALGSNGQIIIDIIPEVELIIGKQPPVPEVGAIEAQNRFNRIFQKFVRVFCSKEHPLVIFLDDLQWIDSATLKLIELLLLDEQTQFLFLIGAYRNNEVNLTHPLILTLEQLRKQGAVIGEIILTPLTLEPLNQLIAETLHQNTDNVTALAQLVLRKTEGNPFFVGEFLRMLHGENLLTFDAKNLCWQWDIAQIQAQNITDNVVELLLNKLEKLPHDTRHILQLAACVGAEFDLDTLSIICEKSSKIVFQDLLVAIQIGLIQPLSELDENLLVQEYKFLHDRVQQAAYALIDETHKQVVHLQIGRQMLENNSLEQITDRLFEIVDNLNQGIDLVTDKLERHKIASLNLSAGQKAKAATAYEAALNYFNLGLKFLNAESWEKEYNLTLALYSEASIAAYLSGHFRQMEQLVGVVLNCAKTVIDKVKVYDSRIQACLSQGNPQEALKIGLEVLRLLEVNIVETPSQLDVQRGLEETALLLDNREIKDFISLPKMTAPEPLAAMYILSSVVAAAFMVSPTLMVLIVCKMVNLSINYGNATCSPLSYAAYGLILCGVVQDIELGYQFGKLSLSLMEKLNAKKENTQALEVLGTHVIHWQEHIKKTLPILIDAYQNGVETGDFEFASYAVYNVCCHSYFVGQELTELEHKITTYSQAISQIRRENPLKWTAILWQTVLNLLGKSENPSRLIGCAYNEEESLPSAIQANDRPEIHYLYLNKLILCYLFGEYHQAVQNAIKAEQYLDGVTALIAVPLFHFYDSLAHLSKLTHAGELQKETWLNRVNINQEKMQKWADYAPMNYLHKFYLVEAEKARVMGQVLEAEEFYEQAISAAAENEFIQEEALAYELAAKFYLERGRTKIAQTYMKEAHYCYERWGATAKVRDLETRYPQLFPQPSVRAGTSIRTTSGNTSNRSDVALDLATVMKASQAISSEIELERLLRSLMQILIENAGAQTGFLILENSGEWLIEASCELADVEAVAVRHPVAGVPPVVGSGEPVRADGFPGISKLLNPEGESVCTTRVLQSLPTKNHLPESIIQYVIRTHESIILNDAIHEGNFTNEPYIQQNQTQSLLCLPLLNQNKLVGVLYLENQLATGAFTPTRTQVLHLLSTQAAIAIENARLYSKLRESESKMTQFLEAIPVGVAVVDTSGCPYYFNQQATQLLTKDIDPSLSLNKLAEVYQTYLAGTDQKYPTERMPIIRALKGERTRVDDIEIHHNNATIPIEAWGTPIFDEHGNVTYAIAAFQDITERKQTEQLLANYNRTLEQQVAERTAALQKSEAELRDREQELRVITDALPVCITYVDANQRYRFANRTYEEWFHRSQGEILGKHIRENLDETSYQVVQPYINQALAGQITTYEAEIPCVFGKKYISNSLIPDFDANGQVKGYYGLITDISEQRNAALRERKRAEEASILEERNRMAREIHDTLAQAFTGILVQVGAATQVLEDDLEATQAHLEMIDELARIGLAEARRSVTALRPQLLEEGDLSSALNRLVTQMRSATDDTALIYEIQGTAYPLPAEVENNLLRIGQEALTNAIKYAKADEIRLELVYGDAQTTLCIKDNGQGFGLGSIPSVGGFGLLGMSERAERIGAQLRIASQLGQGTEIIVIVNRG
ncbi:serine/threonine protein kinase and signal transduction histidine kinase with GAF and PAS/PAC sensor (plasmid) [Trichormus variabilis NIES-23]|uniref:Serine/threonine protein kinase and signal transduction histidine kinase with GAF and PAS/PAC sensor n=1 Tax=Trichormus variabilis NIES-23 TaxID=1973479 RepID=A0A1Z4KWN5_ANAVA|nr:serine/threonine protein kinase and signal transduction histidine kinase with GAF and PAS/PAC sensor [Trichormus variabilis NIES-23]